MDSEVLNTVVGSIVPNNSTPGADKFIFWGHINKTTGITEADVLLLQSEQRVDRFKTFIDFDSGGEHMIVVHPVSYGGYGLFLDDPGGTGQGFQYPFTLSGTIAITDANGNHYDVNIYTWPRKSHGTIPRLETL